MEEKQNSYFYENRFALLKQSNSSMENILRVSIKAVPGDAPPPERLRTVRPSCENFGRSGLMTMSVFHNRQKKHSARYRKEEECSSYLKNNYNLLFSYISLPAAFVRFIGNLFYGPSWIFAKSLSQAWSPAGSLLYKNIIAYKRIYPSIFRAVLFGIYP